MNERGVARNGNDDLEWDFSTKTYKNRRESRLDFFLTEAKRRIKPVEPYKKASH